MGSPFRSVRHDPYSLSSSPGLPPLDQISSKIPKRPPIRTDSVATPIPDHVARGSTSAASFLPQEQPPIDLTTPCQFPTDTPHALPEEEVQVISIANLTKKPRRKRLIKVFDKEGNEITPVKAKKTKSKGDDDDDTAPFKSYLKSKAATEKNAEKKAKVTKPKAAGKTSAKAKAKKAEVVSRHFAKPKDQDEEEPEAPPPSSPKKDANKPLELESALRRRMDWTPPPEDTAANPSHVIDLLSSTAKDSSLVASKETFENLFKNFGRAEDEPARPSVEPPERDNPVLKKRRLIETVSINDTKAAPERTVAKPKAPRKKPRTITELATAAYMAPEATGEEGVVALPLESAEVEAEAPKAKGKKRAPKAKKSKKVLPPEPVLLSPTTALRQAANQDYVFGTSSQLAREHSPSFLRDLQSAIQASNSRLKDGDSFVTPINSDSIEPEPRQQLWAVGARDEDGRVLDLEVINLVDTPQALPVTEGPNPFGYVAEKPNDPLENHFPSEDSFPDIDDLLRREVTDDMSRRQKETEPMSMTARLTEARSAVVEATPTEATLATGASIVKHVVNSTDEEDVDLSPLQPSPKAAQKSMSNPANKTSAVNKPNFDLYTDNQLAREISSYGFKPVKRRQAMLALLDQCWTSKQRTALSSLPTNRSISSTSGSQAVAKPQRGAPAMSPKRARGRPRKNSDMELPSSSPPAAVSPLKRPRGRPRKDSFRGLPSSPPPTVVSPKRPRGRPRKNSEIELPSSEPPPSAQPPPPSPKRPRGRPKKAVEPTAASDATANSRKDKSKAGAETPAVPKASSPAASPRGRKRKSQELIEIPDSASEGSLSPSPFSPEPTFSSPPAVDVSLSSGQVTDMSLAASSTTQQQADLFSRITDAVKTAPPTTNPKQPSFHEMMLMYDPIVLEDLAVWLNTGQLSRVGYDGEVSPGEVKQWCESKSVCCLWRESLRGKERKRY